MGPLGADWLSPVAMNLRRPWLVGGGVTSQLKTSRAVSLLLRGGTDPHFDGTFAT